MKTKLITTNIPAWLFGALYKGKWDDEAEQMAQCIIKSLKNHSEWEYWKPEILEKVLYVNKHDDIKGYHADVVEINKKQ